MSYNIAKRMSVKTTPRQARAAKGIANLVKKFVKTK
jgi:hypothetical protein